MTLKIRGCVSQMAPYNAEWTMADLIKLHWSSGHFQNKWSNMVKLCPHIDMHPLQPPPPQKKRALGFPMGNMHQEAGFLPAAAPAVAAHQLGAAVHGFAGRLREPYLKPWLLQRVNRKPALPNHQSRATIREKLTGIPELNIFFMGKLRSSQSVYGVCRRRICLVAWVSK